MKEVIEIIKREIRKLITDRNLLMIFLVAPLAYPLLYGAIYINKVEEKVPIAVQDLDNSSFSRAFVRDIDAHQNIQVMKPAINDEDFLADIANESVHAVLIIPKDFAKDLKYGRQVDLKLLISPARLLVLSDIGLPISKIAASYGGKITAGALMKKGVPVLQNDGYAQPIKIDFQYLFNSYVTYGDLILPGLIIIILSQIILIGVATSQAKEWLMDKWRDQFKTSDNIFYIAIGKLSAYLLIFLLFAIINFAVIAPFYHIYFGGKMLEKIIIAAVGIISSTALGLFVGTFFKHRITVFVILGFTTYPFFMITGYAWHFNQLPEWIQFISYFLPVTTFLKAIVEVTQLGNSIFSAGNYLLIGISQTFAYTILFMLRLRRIKNRREPKTIIERYIAGFPR